MKKDAEWFEGREPHLIYIAKHLSDAQRLEEIFNASAVDYGVEADEYQGGVIFRRTRVGAFFYIRPEDRERALATMAQAGFRALAGGTVR
jgi:hypothetical protein